MKKFLAGFIVGLVLGAMGGVISTSAQSAPPVEVEAKPTLRIITKVTDKDAVGSLFIADIKRNLSEGMDADVSTGDDLDTDDPSGPELRVMTVVAKGSSEEVIIAVLTYHTQGTDGPPVYLATAGGSVDADGAQEAADEVSRMIVLVVASLEGDLKTHPQAAPQKNKLPVTHPETAIHEDARNGMKLLAGTVVSLIAFLVVLALVAHYVGWFYYTPTHHVIRIFVR